jgi:2-oxoglutarate ferredoxin oxidoreductase subunit beta
VTATCTLTDCGAEPEVEYSMADYQGPVARWCPGCGDHSVLSAVQRLLEAYQMAPERTVFVSGIGCSSRFPHYLRTYGFHGIHGRALPVSTGIKLARPDLDVFAVMGDGDCCSIGAAHWVHATRYNVDMTVLMLDNNIYGLTKKQTSPTTPEGFRTNTQPRGSYLPAMNPLTVTLGITNASFVAQTADWAPQHLYETLDAAYSHKGFSFVRVLQRCPVWTAALFQDAVQDPARVEILTHDDGIRDETTEQIHPHHIPHDPSDLDTARMLAEEGGMKLGLFFQDASRPRYDQTRRLPAATAESRIAVLEREFDRHAV